MWGKVHLHFGETDAKSEMTAWIDGPVRVIHRMDGYVKLAVLKLEGKGGANNVFYPNYLYTPIYFDLPVNPSTLASGFDMNYTIDFNKNATGMVYLDPADGQVKEKVLAFDRRDPKKKELEEEIW